MKTIEAKADALTNEFIVAAQDLHSAGEPCFYMSDISAQMARNDERFMKRHEVVSKILGLVGIQLSDEPLKSFASLYTVSPRLEREGRLESFWEELPPESFRPRRRLYRLVEEV